MEKDSGERRNPEKYYFSIFGTPGDTGTWGYRVEGHHLSQNYTVVNGRVVDAPSFFGSNPAEVREGPRAGLRVLAAEEDLGRDLIASLTAPQLKTAIVDPKAPADILTSNGRQAALQGQASGISAAQMTPAQLTKLTALLDEYRSLSGQPPVALSRYPDLVKMRTLVLSAVLAFCACGPASQAGGIPEYTYQIVHTYPHDPMAYTQGLLYLDGVLYEGTGIEEQSSIRKVKLETGEVLQKRDLPGQYFGEGIIVWKDRLLELTWQAQKGFIYDLASFTPKGEFAYPGEGWGLTTDGKRIIMSDGTAELRFWDPESLQETGRITVTDEGRPVIELNELEWVKGEIYANVWQTDRIARIDPKSGKVVGWIDCRGLLTPADRSAQTDVLNGIAYDAQHDRLFVTGKRWPKLFEIKLLKRP